MYQLATAPRGIGQVLDSVVYLTRRSYRRMLPYTCLLTLLSVSPYIWFMATGAFDDPIRLAAFGASSGYWIAVLVMVPLTMFLYGAGIARIEAIAQGNDISFAASMRIGIARLGVLLVSLVCCVLMVAAGLVFLIIPGVLLMGLLMLFMPAVVLDRKGPIEGLRHSSKLVWGNWWRVTTIATVAAIIMYVMFMLAGILIGYFAVINNFDPAFAFLFEMVATLVSGLLMTAFFCALLAELYREVKMRKTGSDLAARIALVGNPN